MYDQLGQPILVYYGEEIFNKKLEHDLEFLGCDELPLFESERIFKVKIGWDIDFPFNDKQIPKYIFGPMERKYILNCLNNIGYNNIFIETITKEYYAHYDEFRKKWVKVKPSPCKKPYSPQNILEYTMGNAETLSKLRNAKIQYEYTKYVVIPDYQEIIKANTQKLYSLGLPQRNKHIKAIRAKEWSK